MATSSKVLFVIKIYVGLLCFSLYLLLLIITCLDVPVKTVVGHSNTQDADQGTAS